MSRNNIVPTLSIAHRTTCICFCSALLEVLIHYVVHVYAFICCRFMCTMCRHWGCQANEIQSQARLETKPNQTKPNESKPNELNSLLLFSGNATMATPIKKQLLHTIDKCQYELLKLHFSMLACDARTHTPHKHIQSIPQTDRQMHTHTRKSTFISRTDNTTDCYGNWCDSSEMRLILNPSRKKRRTKTIEIFVILINVKLNVDFS